MESRPPEHGDLWFNGLNIYRAEAYDGRIALRIAYNPDPTPDIGFAVSHRRRLYCENSYNDIYRREESGWKRIQIVCGVCAECDGPIYDVDYLCENCKGT